MNNNAEDVAAKTPFSIASPYAMRWVAVLTVVVFLGLIQTQTVAGVYLRAFSELLFPQR